ncbi:hypothetical protein BDQ17DRAFT_1374010 [Cyathus striatus]|nr:hypothetical protein BDQ17DRAFT_1374010 [Cyathus striatus]
MSSVGNESSVYFGFVVSLVCLGVVILQCWNYFTSSFKDRIGLRLFVIAILMLSIVSSCINMVTVHDVLVRSPINAAWFMDQWNDFQLAADGHN